MPMTNVAPTRTPALRALGIVLVLGGTLAAGVLLAWGPAARYLARSWQCQLENARDEEIPLRVQQIAALGDAGVPCLVAALGASREAIARAARQTLSEELTRWKSLEPSEYQPKLDLLAQALVADVLGFGPTARCDAAELAVRILREFPAAARGTILTSCETVLRTTAAERRLWVDQEPGARLTETPAGSAPAATPLVLAATPAWTRPIEPMAPIVTAASLADEGVPAEILAGVSDAQGQPPLRENVNRTAAAPAGPHGLPAVAAVTPSASHSAGGPPASFPAAARPTDSGPAKAEANKPLALPSRLASLDTVELMRQLQVGNVREVETELRQRGFNEVQLELARQLFDSDPQVRRELAQRLPSLQSIDAVPWLLQLCHDEDVEVRALAVSLVATTGDPKLRAEAERIARLDADPRLKDAAERIARQGQKSLR